MQTVNKKGVSTVVSAIFLIIITMASAGIIWSSIKPIVDLSPEVSCAELKIQKPIFFQSICYNSDTNQLETLIKRKLESSQLSNFQISISDDVNNLDLSCGVTCGGQCVILQEGESKKYFIEELTFSPKIAILKTSGCSIDELKIGDCN